MLYDEAYMSIQLRRIAAIRRQGVHYRTHGDMQLFHAAYRSARSRVRSLRKGAETAAPCFCKECKHQ